MVTELKHYLAAEAIEDYREGRLSRRRALRVLSGLVGVAVAARMVDAAAQATPSAASGTTASAPSEAPNRVAPDDPAVDAARVRFAGHGAGLIGYLARPAREGRHAIVLVCHENRGLTPHIEDVARRLAKAGYVALAVDLLSREGGTEKHASDRIPALLGAAPPMRAVDDFQSGLAYVKAQPYAQADRAGMVGFCYGGGVTWRMAVATPELRAIVPYYGAPAPATDIPRINAAVLAIYGGRDARVNAMIPAAETAMEHAGKTFRKVIYPDADHAFNNDTGDRYNAAAAAAAWQETLAWFGRYLQA